MWGTEKLRWTNRVSRATKEENPCGKTSVRAKSEPTDMTVEKIIKARAGLLLNYYAYLIDKRA